MAADASSMAPHGSGRVCRKGGELFRRRCAANAFFVDDVTLLAQIVVDCTNWETLALA